jgi:hypothetical protein
MVFEFDKWKLLGLRYSSFETAVCGALERSYEDFEVWRLDGRRLGSVR